MDEFLSRKITKNIPNLKTKKENTIMKKNKMKITILGCISISLIVTFILVPATKAGAKTIKGKVTSYITKVEVVPVPDVGKHVVGVYERRGVSVLENGETGAYHTQGTFDYTKGQGPFKGYTQVSFADGSIYIIQYQGASTVATGEKLPSFKGSGEYIKGTGRFEGIKGKISFSGKYVTPYTKDKTKGEVYYEFTGTYTLPKK
jgi:hypothetical protein